MKGALLGLLFLFFACCAPSTAHLPVDWQPEGPIDCRVDLSAESVGLMQPFDLTVWAYTEREGRPTPIDLPIPEGFAGEIETDVRRHGGGWVVKRVFHLRPTTLGSLEIPSMRIEFDDEHTTTPARTVEVTSVLRESDDPVALEDPAAPFPARTALWPYFAVAGGLLAVGLLWWWWRRRSRRPSVLPVEVPLPPHATALRALERLRQAERRTESQIEAFYVEVSGILRRYLEERFGLHAPLRSTEEFLIEVERGDDLSLAHRQSLRQFLQQCDLVKFAKLLPGEDIHEQTLRIAETFVQQTRSDQIVETSAGGSAQNIDEVHAGVGGAA